MSVNTIRISSVNVNGVGATSVHKLQKLHHHMCTTGRHMTLIQELKVKSLPIAFRDIFSEPQFSVFFTHVSQGCAIIINNFLLPNSHFSINFSHSYSASTLHQMLEIVDVSDQNSVKISHVYQSPSNPVPKRLFTEFNEFSPDLVIGDPNLTVHGAHFDDWLNQEESAFSQNLIDFKTFQCHKRKTLVTKPDCVFPKTDLIPSINVSDSGVIYSDHVRIDIDFATHLHLPDPTKTPPSKQSKRYNFREKSTEILKIWQNLPQKSNLFQVRQNIHKISEISKVRSKSTSPTNNPPTPAPSNDIAVQQLNQKYAKFCQKVNVTKNLTKVWKFIRKNEKTSKGSPNLVKIARNKQKKSFLALKIKLNRDRSVPLQGIQHDKALKVKRILVKYAFFYKKLSFEEVSFS